MKKILITSVVALFLTTTPLFADAFALGEAIGQSIGSGIKSLFSGDKNSSKEESSGGGLFGDLFKSKTDAELIGESTDKTMTTGVLSLNKKTNRISAKKTSISIDTEIVPFDSAKMLMDAKSLCQNADSLNDDIASVYKKTVMDRGNYYSVYNAGANNVLMKAYNGGELAQINQYHDELYKYDYDYCIVEYNHNGEIVSALFRYDMITLNNLLKTADVNYRNVRITRKSIITFQPKIEQMSKFFSKKSLDDNLVSTSKQTEEPKRQEAQKAVQQPDDNKVQKIKDLFELYKSGAITKEEYDAEKKKLLEQQPTQTPQPQIQTQQQKPQVQAGGFEAVIVQKFNQQNGTNFSTMKEVMEYKAQQQK